jgi:N-acetylglucosaminyldiphosphoundecaprenol N-acetyl-beta-D-mannosaminyltransferase
MSAFTSFPTVYVGGVPFAATTIPAVSAWLLEQAVPRRMRLNVRLANAYNVALANQEPAYGDLLKNEGVNLPDGTPVVSFMRLQRGTPKAERVRGPSLFPFVLRESVPRGTRHFLLGGTSETLRRLEERICATYPGITIAGCYSPPFAPVDEAYVTDCADRIRASAADIVWVGLGTPKQDQLGTALSRQIDAVSVNVGAAFDFLAGTAREAPVWVQRSGFEWLFRLASEPKRLWRRYLVGNCHFLLAATRALLKGNPVEASHE